MKELLRAFRPKIIILIEPMISGEAVDKVCKGLGRRRWIRSEARGFSRRIWVLWEEGEVEVKLEEAHRSFLHMVIRLGTKRRWALTAVYVRPQAVICQFLWDNLDALEVGIPWILIRDFNCILQVEERSSRMGASSSIGSLVSRNGLIDLGFVGTCYTWSHGKTVETRREARLDRALCYDEWRREFARATV